MLVQNACAEMEQGRIFTGQLETVIYLREHMRVTVISCHQLGDKTSSSAIGSNRVYVINFVTCSGMKGNAKFISTRQK